MSDRAIDPAIPATMEASGLIPDAARWRWEYSGRAGGPGTVLFSCRRHRPAPRFELVERSFTREGSAPFSLLIGQCPDCGVINWMD